MSEQTAAPQTAAPTLAAEPVELWVERTGTRAYTGRNNRGGEVLIASQGVPGAFTPGELLKIALAGCTGLSADFTLSRRLGDNFDATVRVSGDADRENELYPELNESFELDMSELDEESRQRLLVAAQRAIDKVCTVGRTLKAGTVVNLSFTIDE
ncbi:OsmC-like protein [Nocardia otitidiscaviarum]|uniref:OsmC family protein n=1 Tax=Nocardia otitidiscaviarum TaxID=1823 RepID=A0A378YPU9_9NOCA|nr:MULTISPECIES: OsmC family protein [Nocardia]MBF6182641.1 OsmC family protein [Nocardia otitidiscaviarum]MBF6238951.1 OsmC family protein [Nocardia otitidiscaviarum]MCP9623820.1 OsmC family protein [Nocardia otitidiscaviarum]QDP80902.1 OsmC family protein [Nocardia otitidiscaviarum]SUA79134.1 OsmC-like protein [Nocardia otitidiscaviarum]